MMKLRGPKPKMVSSLVLDETMNETRAYSHVIAPSSTIIIRPSSQAKVAVAPDELDRVNNSQTFIKDSQFDNNSVGCGLDLATGPNVWYTGVLEQL